MTGVQFTKELRKSRQLQHVPVMVVTAADDRAVRYAALEAGAWISRQADRSARRSVPLSQSPSPDASIRVVKNYSLLQESKLDRLQQLLRSLVGDSTQNLAQRVERDELVMIAYDKLFAITSCVAGVQELVRRCPTEHRRSRSAADPTASRGQRTSAYSVRLRARVVS